MTDILCVAATTTTATTTTTKVRILRSSILLAGSFLPFYSVPLLGHSRLTNRAERRKQKHGHLNRFSECVLFSPFVFVRLRIRNFREECAGC